MGLRDVNLLILSRVHAELSKLTFTLIAIRDLDLLLIVEEWSQFSFLV